MSDKDKKRDDPYELRYIYVAMELELVESLKRNYLKHKKEEIEAGFSWEMWQSAMLRGIEQYRRENQQIIGKYSKEIQEVIDETLKTAYKESYSGDIREESISMPKDEANTGKPGEVPPRDDNFFGANKKKLNAMIESTKKDFDDVNKAIYRKMDDVYRQTMYKTQIQFGHGAISLGKAIDKATEEFLAKGIDCIVYKNGRHVHIATYAEMCLRTTQHRAKLLGDGTKRDELGHYLVLVSAHINSCKLCMPWQGQILIDDVFSHPSNEYIVQYASKHKKLSEAVKAGLLHPNCRHTIVTWFDGINKIPHQQDPTTVEKNYKAEQKQRALEVALRRAKREYAGVVDENDKVNAKKRLVNARKALVKHLKDNPQLVRHERREKLFGTNKKLMSNLDNFDDSSLQGVDERTIIEIDNALTKIYKEYPHLKGIISEVRVIEKVTAEAEIDIQNQGLRMSLGINKKLTPENASSLTKRMYDEYKWTKKPGIEGIIRHEMGHVLNYDYYVRKNGLEYGKPYGDTTLRKLVEDLEKNELATVLRKETLEKLGVADTDEKVVSYFSSYAKNKSMTNNGEFFAEAFSDYSDTNAKFIFMELLKERMK